MDEEMQALKKNSTWDVVDLPREKEPVGCRRVFSVKLQPNDTIERLD